MLLAPEQQAQDQLRGSYSPLWTTVASHGFGLLTGALFSPPEQKPLSSAATAPAKLRLPTIVQNARLNLLKRIRLHPERKTAE
ncbi:hypothetical protein EYF80_013100 [Liparis tanakae]|uniref:Uncharacterized protein n=1 Tax=Liparis tanakae TaxID=230148 RepID=A0A4Z2IF98_9TELE|nr:hypothetical protein EYF80_013100 [Liparis tanakae]